MSRKIHPSAKLKKLPAPVQQQLYDLYHASSGKPALAWLKKTHGVTSSTGALSDFSGWFPFSRPLERVAENALIIEARLKAHPDIKKSAEEISIMGQIAFEQMALEDRNLSGFVSLRRQRQAEKNFELEVQKFREATKTNIERGLDALQAECSANAEALQLFEKFKTAVMNSVGAKTK